MLIKKIDDISADPVEADGARDVKVRVLFGAKDGAPTFALRQFDISPGGCTPYHTHPFEHEVVVLQGQLNLVTEQQDEIPISVGDTAMVLPGERHQFSNPSADQPAKMLCIVPIQYQK